MTTLYYDTFMLVVETTEQRKCPTFSFKIKKFPSGCHVSPTAAEFVI